MSSVTVRIADEPYVTSIKAGPHEIVADEPSELGGADSGPDPYGLLLASLGSCKAITASMYARRKGWPLDAMELDLSHTREDGFERIDVVIRVFGDLDDTQRERLVEIAGKCPVEKTITGELRVNVRTEAPA
ncbi:MAG: osmotically inducible protein C [Phycisphaeraceae bacterium]|nr:MAG: osmotically inducible protein C [Phycisphaeraceae bacterium]